MNGQQRAEQGMARAQDHAHSVIPGWTEQVLAAFRAWMIRQRKPFAVEDFRLWVEENKPELVPPSHQAWGTVGRLAISRGMVKHVGWRPARSPATNSHPVRVLVRVK